MSPFFLVPKPDGSDRFILNLKKFNDFVKKEHFKIEDLRTALNLLDKDDFMCSLDLKDAYLLVTIYEEDKKYLRFECRNQLYQFNALPFGLTSAPFVFTKICKPIVNWLRTQGVRLVIYLDDFLIIGRTQEEALRYTKLIVSLLLYLGFLINWEKSELEPQNSCQFLGMIINSAVMSLELPEKKCANIKDTLEVLSSKKIKIESLAELIGVLVAACPGEAYGWLYYKELELVKRRALILHQNNPNKWTSLSEEAIQKLKWWRSQISTEKNKIRSSHFDLVIFSDASSTGWGAICGNESAQGLWSSSERKMHINYLEIKATFLGLRSFVKNCSNKQILLRIDNITALAYINKMRGIKYRSLNHITKKLWEWCRNGDIWVFAEYIASSDNLADVASRVTNVDIEWELSNAFQIIIKRFGNPSIDLFASRIITKCIKYCSWERDPEAAFINAFTVSWKQEFWYAFPPFSLIPRVLKKVKEDSSTGIFVVPFWTVQPWYPEFKNLLISDTIFLKPSTKLLISPCRKIIHPLAPTLTLVSGIVLGKLLRQRTWKMTQLP